MKKPPKKTRKELHLEFIKSIGNALDRSQTFKYTKHNPVDRELDRIRDERLMVNDLFQWEKRIGKVIKVTGSLIDAIDIQNNEEFKVLTYWVKKL